MVPNQPKMLSRTSPVVARTQNRLHIPALVHLVRALLVHVPQLTRSFADAHKGSTPNQQNANQPLGGTKRG